MASPSDRSIIAVAPSSPSARPAARRGRGRGVALAKSRRNMLGQPVWSLALEDSETGARPSETSRHSDAVSGAGAVAPDELARIVGPAHDRERDGQRGSPRHVAAGDRDAAVARQAPARRPPTPARRRLESPRGTPSARYASPGSAPIAARSDSADASARWPISRGDSCAAAEVDAVDERVDRGHGVAARPDHRGVVAQPPDHPRAVARQAPARARRSARARASAETVDQRWR